MPPCPMCKKAHPSMCGLKLFGSENECPICMEKQSDMIALSCGHQFCSKCLGRVGIRLGPSPVVHPITRPPAAIGWASAMARAARASAMTYAARPPPVTMAYRRVVGNNRAGRLPPPLAIVQRHVQRRLQPRADRVPRRRRATRQRKRCGWCGHIGHTQRKCTAHRHQCGCKTYKSAKHKRLYRLKPKCVVCVKKGHRFRTCANIVKGFK